MFPQYPSGLYLSKAISMGYQVFTDSYLYPGM